MYSATKTFAGKAFLIATGVLAIAPVAAPAIAAKRAVPYFASIGAGRARMRTGPARTYPASWLYQRADLPVRVVAIYKEWRKVEDPDGVQGWMEDRLLRDARTAIVRAPQPVEMHEQPSMTSRLAWRVAPGVVGRVGQCGNGWCRLDVRGQAGFVETGNLWGVGPTETLP